jgi:histidinol-phosphate aminotransferase
VQTGRVNNYVYGVLVGVNGGRLRKVPLTADLEFDLPALGAAVADADVTILCSPNNPTGRQLPRAALEELLRQARGLIVLDEAYVEFAPDCLTDLVAKYRHLVVLRTFSKALALAGLRLGYLVGDPALVAEISKAKLPYNLNFFSTTAAEVALDHAGRLRTAIEELKAERARVIAALCNLPGFEPLPTDANFMLVRSEHEPRQLFDALLAAGVLVRDVSSHPALSRYFRFNIGTRAENDRFLELLSERSLEWAAPSRD